MMRVEQGDSELVRTLKNLCNARGMLLTDLATASNTSKSTVSQVLSGGIKEPSLRVIAAFAKALGVPANTLTLAMGYDMNAVEGQQQDTGVGNIVILSDLDRLSPKKRDNVLKYITNRYA